MAQSIGLMSHNRDLDKNNSEKAENSPRYTRSKNNKTLVGSEKLDEILSKNKGRSKQPQSFSYPTNFENLDPFTPTNSLRREEAQLRRLAASTSHSATTKATITEI